MNFLKLLVILYCVIYAYSKDCDTPIECLTQAISMLKQDRAEMRRQMDEYKTKLEETEKHYQMKLEETEKKYQMKLEETEKKYEDLINKIQTDLKHSLNALVEDISVVKNEVNSIPRYGGSYQTGNFYEHNNIPNPRTGGYTCPAGYTSQQVGNHINNGIEKLFMCFLK